MHDDRIDAGLLQKCDVARKGAPEFGISHGVTAIFHDDRLRGRRALVLLSHSVELHLMLRASALP